MSNRMAGLSALAIVAALASVDSPGTTSRGAWGGSMSPEEKKRRQAERYARRYRKLKAANEKRRRKAWKARRPDVISECPMCNFRCWIVALAMVDGRPQGICKECNVTVDEPTNTPRAS